MYKVTLLLDANYRVLESHTEPVGAPIKVPSPPPQIVLQPNQIKMYEDLRLRSMFNANRNTEVLSFAEQYKSQVPQHPVWAKVEQETEMPAGPVAPDAKEHGSSAGDWKLVQSRHNARQSRRSS